MNQTDGNGLEHKVSEPKFGFLPGLRQRVEDGAKDVMKHTLPDERFQDFMTTPLGEIYQGIRTKLMSLSTPEAKREYLAGVANTLKRIADGMERTASYFFNPGYIDVPAVAPVMSRIRSGGYDVTAALANRVNNLADRYSK